MLLATVELKLVPVIVTLDPTMPEPGLKPEIVGGAVTVNAVPLVAVEPLTVTVIGPVVAADGTVATS